MPTRFRYRCIVDGETFNPWPRANTASFSRQKPVASRHALTWLANSPLNNPLGPLWCRRPPLHSPPAYIPPRLPPSIHPTLYRPPIYPQPPDRFRIVLSTCFPSLYYPSDIFSCHVSFYLPCTICCERTRETLQLNGNTLEWSRLGVVGKPKYPWPFCYPWGQTDDTARNVLNRRGPREDRG